MASTHIHVRIDENTKLEAQRILSEMGLDMSTAVNMFFKQIITKNGFPFLPVADPFYSDSNIAHLLNVKADVDAGRNMEVHELIEA
jgi:DNA-damage-inducible protein J